MDKLDIIINKTKDIIDDTKINKAYLFDINNVEKFISMAVDLILSEIEKLII